MLPIWTIYDHPKDVPDKFVARLFVGDQATGEALIADDLAQLRLYMHHMGLTCLDRHPEDDPVIVETWL